MAKDIKEKNEQDDPIVELKNSLGEANQNLEDADEEQDGLLELIESGSSNSSPQSGSSSDDTSASQSASQDDQSIQDDTQTIYEDKEDKQQQ